MIQEFESIDLKPYKGFDVQKCYWLDLEGHRKGKPFYLVAAEEGYIGEEYHGLDEAHRFIDSLL